jgi:hypothetical protein
MKLKAKKMIEAAIVVAVAAGAFVLARRLGVEQRGNTLIGGEVCVPLLIVGGWYAVKSIIKDIKGGLFHE